MHQKLKSADFFKKLLGNSHTVDPRVIYVDKSPTFPPALNELQAENKAPKKTNLRAIKYLNNRMEMITNSRNLNRDTDSGIDQHEIHLMEWKPCA